MNMDDDVVEGIPAPTNTRVPPTPPTFTRGQKRALTTAIAVISVGVVWVWALVVFIAAVVELAKIVF